MLPAIGALIGLLLPSPVDMARKAVEPNPYAPSLPTQFNVALGQMASRGIRGGLSGLTGSEADYQAEQISGNSAIGAELTHLRNDDVPIPPSRLTPRLPDQVMGHGTGPQTGAYNKGWVDLESDPARGWGGSTRTIHKAQNAINGTLLDPLIRAPLPRDAQRAFEAASPSELRLEDVYGSNS